MKQLEYSEVMEKKDLLSYSRKIYLVLDDLRLPPNIAGIFRLADGFSVSEIILLCNKEFVLSKKFRSISRVDGQNVSHKVLSENEIIQWIKAKKKTAEIAAIEFTDTSLPMTSIPEKKDMVLIMGSERHGIRPSFLEHCTSSFHIPMQGELSSLNVTTAAAIAMYEVRRSEILHS